MFGDEGFNLQAFEPGAGREQAGFIPGACPDEPFRCNDDGEMGGCVVGEQWEVWAAPAALTIVFFNLYLNAAQQIDMLVRTGIRGGGRIWHTCERCFDEHGKEQAIVRIHDTGPGIHREDWDLIFKPGYTTKARGWGLGLSLSERR